MISSIISDFLQNFHQTNISNIRAVGGGSINFCYQYMANEQHYFVKYNNVNHYPDIIKNEVEGLNAISNTKSIQISEIIEFNRVDNFELLILRYIEQGRPSSKVWDLFARLLGEMHQNYNDSYGWNKNNYIGSLSQSNTYHTDFITFFIKQRLQKQIELAKYKGLLEVADIAGFEKLYAKLPEVIPEAKPSLVHGDLWSGNFLVSKDEIPYLIDPSIHYNFRETDIAFTYLFGGFDQHFYDAYQSAFPLAPGFKERVKIYNLYPLLVHLNLFGRSYLSSIQSVIKLY